MMMIDDGEIKSVERERPYAKCAIKDLSREDLFCVKDI